MIARVARAVAVALALAAVLDPSFAADVRGRASVAVIEPAGSHIADHLRRDYLVVRGFDPAAAAFVVAGHERPAIDFPEEARIATVSDTGVREPSIDTVDAPAAVPSGTTIRVDATIATAARAETMVVARIAGVTVGRARHVRRPDEDRWRASLEVVPIGDAPWVISLSSDGATRDLVVDRAPRIPVTFYEPRPSWAATFVRRALERDPRFDVHAVTRLEMPDAAAVVVGGLERVSDADVAVLDRFARDRGGALVVLPDEQLGQTSPAARLVGAHAAERVMLLEHSAPLMMSLPLPQLAASELLTFEPDREAEVLARSAAASRVVVWSARRGEGRLLVSGALDAWRSRSDSDQAFDRFWRAAISSVALATPPLVDVRVSPSVAEPLERVRVRVRVQRSILAENTSVSASLASGETIRLWPDAAAGAFSGTLVAPKGDGVSRIDVAAVTGTTRATGSAHLAARADTLHIPSTPGTLGTLSATHHGIDIPPSDLPSLDRWLRDTVTPPVVRATRHPMRSPWWMLPFVACLSIDWWITSSRTRRR